MEIGAVQSGGVWNAGSSVPAAACDRSAFHEHLAASAMASRGLDDRRGADAFEPQTFAAHLREVNLADRLAEASARSGTPVVSNHGASIPARGVGVVEERSGLGRVQAEARSEGAPQERAAVAERVRVVYRVQIESRRGGLADVIG